MSRKIVKIAFTKTNKEVLQSSGHRSVHLRTSGDVSYEEQTYDYLAPEGATGTENYAVISTGKVLNATSMKIARIVAWDDASNTKYEGELKPVVAVFDAAKYSAELERAERKKALLHRIKNKLSERSLVSQLESMIGDDAEARALLEEFKSL